MQQLYNFLDSSKSNFNFVQLLSTEDTSPKILVTSNTDYVSTDTTDRNIVLVDRSDLRKAITSCLEEPLHDLFDKWISHLMTKTTTSKRRSLRLITEIENIKKQMTFKKTFEECGKNPADSRSMNIVPNIVKEYLRRQLLLCAYIS